MAYVGTFALTLATAFLILRLWRADLAVPFAYEHDSFPILTWTKTMIDNGCVPDSFDPRTHQGTFAGAPCRLISPVCRGFDLIDVCC